VIRLHLVVESCTIRSSRWPVRKLLDTFLYHSQRKWKAVLHFGEHKVSKGVPCHFYVSLHCPNVYLLQAHIQSGAKVFFPCISLTRSYVWYDITVIEHTHGRVPLLQGAAIPTHLVLFENINIRRWMAVEFILRIVQCLTSSVTFLSNTTRGASAYHFTFVVFDTKNAYFHLSYLHKFSLPK